MKEEFNIVNKIAANVQAFCLCCEKAVELPHRCPTDNNIYTKPVKRKSVGL